ncbi:hypothetical protein ABH922_002260 [Rhodococcus sp. 27YEA15]|uniref:restriction endonuclease n=1 Tax=Rhodococcus sp. 27YEA15 TaxID=3156259 RepID=UPI003C7ACE53
MAEMITPAEAEEFAASHMRKVGFEDACVTGRGSDGGVDVTSSGAVAQVKLHFKPTGRPDLQRLFGARAHETSKAMLFYTFAGFSKAAVTYADSVEMALFRVDIGGTVTPLNESAQSIATRRPKPAVWVAPPPRVFYSTPAEFATPDPVRQPDTPEPKSKRTPSDKPKWYDTSDVEVTQSAKVKQKVSSKTRTVGKPRGIGKGLPPKPVEPVLTRSEQRRIAHRELLAEQKATRHAAMSSRTKSLIAEWKKLPLDTVIVQMSAPRKKAVHEDQLEEYVRLRRENEPLPVPVAVKSLPAKSNRESERPPSEKESDTRTPHQISAPTVTYSGVPEQLTFDPSQAPASKPKRQAPPETSTLQQSPVDPTLEAENRRARRILVPVFGACSMATLLLVIVSGLYGMIALPLIFAVFAALVTIYSRSPHE